MLFPRLQGKCQGITSQDGARPALFQSCCVALCIVCFVSFYVLFVCKCVLLPPGDNPNAVNKYIISYFLLQIFGLYGNQLTNSLQNQKLTKELTEWSRNLLQNLGILHLVNKLQPDVRERVHKIPLLDRIVREMNTFHVNHFYCPTNALNYTNLEVKICVV